MRGTKYAADVIDISRGTVKVRYVDGSSAASRAQCQPLRGDQLDVWLWVKTNLVPFWGGCTTHFRTYFSGDWDVHWGHGILSHGLF